MGDKTCVTMKTLATKLGVSVTTVSNAYSKPDRLSAELREQIFATAKELGYCGPSAAGRALRSGKTGVCGFLLGFGGVPHAFADPYSVIFLGGLAEAAEEYGASVLLLRAPEDADDAADLLRRAPIDALVVSSTVGEVAYEAQLRQRGVRIVRTEAMEAGDWVTINDVEAGRMIGSHLAQLGHRNLVVIASGGGTGTEEFDVADEAMLCRLGGEAWARDRVQGLSEALPDARIRVVFAGGYSRLGGHAATGQTLDMKDRPTAVVALSDVLALGAWDAALERGLHPGRDVSISGFDDIPECGFLGITTVHQPIAEKGRLAGRLAMDPDYPQRQVTLPVELVVRSSTGPAPKN
ncbi:MAG: LacI family DNA-binding transcriptional regulator [Actinobacteria bacterium]|nr:LacI family DNA-binding transcriptional regulator [Actinomycetota bacterium]